MGTARVGRPCGDTDAGRAELRRQRQQLFGHLLHGVLGCDAMGSVVVEDAVLQHLAPLATPPLVALHRGWRRTGRPQLARHRALHVRGADERAGLPAPQLRLAPAHEGRLLIRRDDLAVQLEALQDVDTVAVLEHEALRDARRRFQPTMLRAALVGRAPIAGRTLLAASRPRLGPAASAGRRGRRRGRYIDAQACCTDLRTVDLVGRWRSSLASWWLRPALVTTRRWRPCRWAYPLKAIAGISRELLVALSLQMSSPKVGRVAHHVAEFALPHPALSLLLLVEFALRCRVTRSGRCLVRVLSRRSGRWTQRRAPRRTESDVRE